ncbi:hypothetical protein FYJ24_10100 [Actinomycetaceae bacterium WB03_NA08]|uniref:Uncharacterized protein n=1 Tax=Scrofimicrobium canadense TaxID=2652290 RepID=A0A6N7WA42_9ACTO|nr:hypothetical protein [Scrofimicrobium canadense]MSS85106.1 hypothetical protein [Scrofimicrobium canadense]
MARLLLSVGFDDGIELGLVFCANDSVFVYVVFREEFFVAYSENLIGACGVIDGTKAFVDV